MTPDGAGVEDGVAIDGDGEFGEPGWADAEGLGVTDTEVQPTSTRSGTRATPRGRIRQRTLGKGLLMTASILVIGMRASRVLLPLCALLLAGCAATTRAESEEVPGEPAHCAILDDARRTVDHHLALLLTLDDPGAQAELLGEDAPFRIDPGALRTAVQALSMLSGADGELGTIRRITELLQQHTGLDDPLAPGSDTGRQLAQLADAASTELRTGLHAALRASGCAVIG